MDYSFLLSNIDLVPSICLPDVCAILSHVVVTVSENESHLKNDESKENVSSLSCTDEASAAPYESFRIPDNLERQDRDLEQEDRDSYSSGFDDALQYSLNQCNEDSMMLSDVDSDATIDLIDCGNEQEDEGKGNGKNENENEYDKEKENENENEDDCSDNDNDNEKEKEEMAFNTQDLCDEFQRARIGIDDDAIEDFSDEEVTSRVEKQHCRLPLVLKNDKSKNCRTISEINDKYELEGGTIEGTRARDHKNLSRHLAQQDSVFHLCCYSSESRARVYKSLMTHFIPPLSEKEKCAEIELPVSPWMNRNGKRRAKQGHLLIVTTKSHLPHWSSTLATLQPSMRVLNYTEPLSVRRRQGMSDTLSCDYNDIVVTTFDILKSKEVMIDPSIIHTGNYTGADNNKVEWSRVEQSYLHLYQWHHVLIDYADARNVKLTNQAGTAVYNLHTTTTGSNSSKSTSTNTSSRMMSILQVEKPVLKVDIITDSFISHVCENMKLPRHIPPSSLLFDARRIV